MRSLRKSPGYASVVVLTLGLGLGVNTALFTWFNAAAFRPLPVVRPDGLYSLQRLDEKWNATKAMSYADFVAYRDQQTVFSGLAAATDASVTLVEADPSDEDGRFSRVQLRVQTVSPNYFTVFSVPMALGRPLSPADETSTRALPVIVISHRFWQNNLGGDPGVIGRTLRLKGLAEEALTIVGVTSPDFLGTKPGAVVGWVPALLRRGEQWRTDLNSAGYLLTGRLRTGVAREQAEEELSAIANALLPRSSRSPKVAESITLLKASTYLNLGAKDLPFLLPLFALFGAVFVVSCANASNLILARTVTRQFEFAVRSALGASRWRLCTQIMTESLTLGLGGGLAGWGVAAGLLQFVWPRLLDLVPVAREGTAGLILQADYRVFVFTLGVSILAGAAGGLFPALQVTRRNVESALKQEGSAFGRGIRVSRLRNFLVVAQLALSAALLFTAGLLAHRSLRLQFQDLGFDSAPLVTLEVLTPTTLTPDELDSARRQALERVRTLPGVAAVSAMPGFPFASAQTTVSLPSVEIPGGRRIDNVVRLTVPASFFSTLQLPPVRGRTFSAEEGEDDQVVIISEKAARLFWPDTEALGRQLEVPRQTLPGGRPDEVATGNEANAPRVLLTVVGIVPEARVYDPGSGDRAVIYLPLGPSNAGLPHLLVRMDQAIERPPAALREATRAVTGLAPSMISVKEGFATAFVLYQVTAWVAVILAGLSLIIAVIGLHGMMTFTVNQRTKEIGIRMALGATSGRVISTLVLECLKLVGLGTFAGYALSWAIVKAARAMLFGVTAVDPLASLGIVLLLGAVALLACWFPARHAAKVDPVVALRAE